MKKTLNAPDQAWQLITRNTAARGNTIHLAEVGSTIHGISVADQDDLDLTAVRMEPWREFANAYSFSKRQSRMVRTQPEGVRSRLGDIDIQVFTLRKFTTLAIKGNPSILTALWSPKSDTTTLGLTAIDRLQRIAPSQAAGHAYLGYMKSQLERWQGKRGQKNVNRPELVEAYGFDTKYAGHVVRLGLQGIEYLNTGRLTLPMDEETARRIRKLRTGGLDEMQALDWAFDVEHRLKDAMTYSTLPQHPATHSAEKFLADIYRHWYTANGDLTT